MAASVADWPRQLAVGAEAPPTGSHSPAKGELVGAASAATGLAGGRATVGVEAPPTGLVSRIKRNTVVKSSHFLGHRPAAGQAGARDQLAPADTGAIAGHAAAADAQLALGGYLARAHCTGAGIPRVPVDQGSGGNWGRFIAAAIVVTAGCDYRVELYPDAARACCPPLAGAGRSATPPALPRQARTATMAGPVFRATCPHHARPGRDPPDDITPTGADPPAPPSTRSASEPCTHVQVPEDHLHADG